MQALELVQNIVFEHGSEPDPEKDPTSLGHLQDVPEVAYGHVPEGVQAF